MDLDSLSSDEKLTILRDVACELHKSFSDISNEYKPNNPDGEAHRLQQAFDLTDVQRLEFRVHVLSRYSQGHIKKTSEGLIYLCCRVEPFRTLRVEALNGYAQDLNIPLPCKPDSEELEELINPFAWMLAPGGTLINLATEHYLGRI
ncbi:hypothetical protein V5098_23480 [Vibrio coralliirubri]|uniref:hypothetical protein n=1 Tax=Vibrio coralliirubri TaxID=1516159 RepID=UPI002FD101A3